QSPRAKLPSTRVTPAGSRLLPRASARAAPASRCAAPLGVSEPAIHFLRAVIGLDGVRNHVQRSPAAMRASGEGARPSAISICAPPVVAILAASILVRMPPREYCEAAPPAIASISAVTRGTTGISVASGFSPGGAV